MTMQASETVSDIPGEPCTLMHSPRKHCFYPEATKQHQDTWSVTQMTSNDVIYRTKPGDHLLNHLLLPGSYVTSAACIISWSLCIIY